MIHPGTLCGVVFNQETTEDVCGNMECNTIWRFLLGCDALLQPPKINSGTPQPPFVQGSPYLHLKQLKRFGAIEGELSLGDVYRGKHRVAIRVPSGRGRWMGPTFSFLLMSASAFPHFQKYPPQTKNKTWGWCLPPFPPFLSVQLTLRFWILGV